MASPQLARRACGFAWEHHACARPARHPGEHDCWCGTYHGRPEDAASASAHAREAARQVPGG